MNVRRRSGRVVIPVSKTSGLLQVIHQTYPWTTAHTYYGDALLAIGWDIRHDVDGNIADMRWGGAVLSTQMIRDLALLAPFIDAGSFVEAQNDAGIVWRWVFDGANVRVHTPVGDEWVADNLWHSILRESAIDADPDPVEDGGRVRSRSIVRRAVDAVGGWIRQLFRQQDLVDR